MHCAFFGEKSQTIFEVSISIPYFCLTKSLAADRERKAFRLQHLAPPILLIFFSVGREELCMDKSNTRNHNKCH